MSTKHESGREQVPVPPTLLLAPGAGAGSASAWMQAWRTRLAAIASVEVFDYPYRLKGRKAPDKLPVLIEAHREAARAARARHPGAAGLVLIGKSMGGRVGCHLALDEPIDALVCLGYPLRGASGKWRDEVLLALRTPVLFVQGTRDPLCPLEQLDDVRKRMTAPNDLLVVAGGNHSLEVPRPRASRAQVTAGVAADDPQVISDARVLLAITNFLAGALAPA